jgi:hypothetical protein
MTKLLKPVPTEFPGSQGGDSAKVLVSRRDIPASSGDGEVIVENDGAMWSAGLHSLRSGWKVYVCMDPQCMSRSVIS